MGGRLLRRAADAHTLGPILGLSPEGIRRVMHAGASWNRWEGVRLSNGLDVVDPDDLRGQGIGTVAFNAIIDWAQRRHPVAEVRPIALTRHHKKDVQPDDPRLAFYRRFGLDWCVDDQRENDPDWLSLPTDVTQLRQVVTLPLPDVSLG